MAENTIEETTIEETTYWSDAFNRYLPDFEDINVTVFGTREEWLDARGNTIGGSDASCVVGLNPYKSNVQLAEEKISGTPPKDISDLPYVAYGIEAEEPLRYLFGLDYKRYRVGYFPNNMWKNAKYPFAHYSADGWMIDRETHKIGLLEIKTTNILQSVQKESWKDRIPDNYYIQCLHGLAVTNAEFIILKAQLKNEFGKEIYLQTKHYRIDRADVEDDIAYLMDAEREFMEYVKSGKKPPLILPM